MVVLNDLDRFHLVEDVIDRLPQLGSRAAYLKQAIHERLIEHKAYIERHGDDMPAISPCAAARSELDLVLERHFPPDLSSLLLERGIDLHLVRLEHALILEHLEGDTPIPEAFRGA
jgi:hypothetical protein